MDFPKRALWLLGLFAHEVGIGVVVFSAVVCGPPGLAGMVGGGEEGL